jgi:hypothetical protein
MIVPSHRNKEKKMITALGFINDKVAAQANARFD